MATDTTTNSSAGRLSPGTAAGEASPRTAAGLSERYQQVRQATERLCEPLETEDHVIQSMPDVSPTKWHLAHTSWFFETFLLGPHAPGYQVFHPLYGFLFNSYYVSVGERHDRPHRGLLSRPTVAEVYAYRKHVDEQMRALLEELDDASVRELTPLIDLGLNHEQQHQELLLTDIKHVFGTNPLRPTYRPRKIGTEQKEATISPMQWIGFDGGIHWIGHEKPSFCYDNELPRHRALVGAFHLGSRLITNGEFRAFMGDGGYQRPTLWLSDGWAVAEQEQWRAPLYWVQQDGQWWHHTLNGFRPVEDNEPVCHVSYFEADAYARWAGARLPTEFEWEVASRNVPVEGNFLESGQFHPAPSLDNDGQREPAPQQMFGDAWEWTASQYSPYPGYAPAAGAVGEYNGKFMCNQFVLRGGSCATPSDHVRRTYRNFFPPAARWQFTGFRLARNP